MSGPTNIAVKGVEVSATNPVPVTGNFNAVTAATASAAPPAYVEGSTSPLSMDLAGNIRIAGTISAAATDMLNLTGSASSATTLFTRADTTAYFTAAVQVTAYAGIDLVAEASNDGAAWAPVSDLLSGSTVMTGLGEFVFNCYAKQFRVRQSVYGGAGTSTVNCNLRGAVYNGVPAGGATSAKQDISNASLAAIATVLGSPLSVTGSFYRVTQPVSAASLPLPTGAATETTLAAVNTKLAGNIGVTGTFWQATQPISAAALPLPTGAATQTTLAAILAAIGTPMQAGGAIGNTGFLAAQSGAWTVSVTGGVAVTGTFWQATQPVSLAALPALVSGTAIIGKVAIDQTTPGTTNAVSVTNDAFPNVARAGKADQATTLTSTTAETTIITATGGVKHDLYGLIVENTSATACEVAFRDVAAGTVRFSLMIPPGETRGFMLASSDGFNQAAVNTAWTAQCAASVASIKISAMYVNN